MRPDLFDAIAAEATPLLESLPQDRRILVWGAGEHGRWLMTELDHHGVGFIDSNPAKHGTEIADKPVHPIAELERLEWDEIWVAVLSDVQGIRDRLVAAGHTEGQDFRVPFPGGKRRQVLDKLPRTLTFLEDLEIAGRDVLEVGFGGQLYLASMLLHLGARSVRVTDVEAQTGALHEHEGEWISFLEHLSREHGPAPATPAELLQQLELHPQAVSASRLPFPAKRFDLVVNTGVMEHVDDPAGAIEEFGRILCRGGQALNLAIGIHDHRANDPRSAFTPWSFLEQSDAEWGSAGCNAYHQNRWRAVDFERAYGERGFEILKAEKVLDPRLRPAEIARFDARFREGYGPEELAELDLYIAARRC